MESIRQADLGIMIDIPPEPPGPKGFPTKAFLIGAVVMAALWIVGMLMLRSFSSG